VHGGCDTAESPVFWPSDRWRGPTQSEALPTHAREGHRRWYDHVALSARRPQPLEPSVIRRAKSNAITARRHVEAFRPVVVQNRLRQARAHLKRATAASLALNRAPYAAAWSCENFGRFARLRSPAR
jgi:hypothetical protein